MNSLLRASSLVGRGEAASERETLNLIPRPGSFTSKKIRIEHSSLSTCVFLASLPGGFRRPEEKR